MSTYQYALTNDNYTICQALGWQIFLGHCKKTVEGSWRNRIVHVLIAAAELLPIISQIASLFEYLIVKPSFQETEPPPILKIPLIEKKGLESPLSGDTTLITLLPHSTQTPAVLEASKIGSIEIMSHRPTSISLRLESQAGTTNASLETVSESKMEERTPLAIFKDSLAKVVISYDTDQVKRDLAEIIPKGVELADILDVIFDGTDIRKIKFQIIGFLNLYPSYTLSPLNQMRKSIIDRFPKVTNESLNAMFRVERLTETQIQSCYYLGYLAQNPDIYELSDSPLPVAFYSLNFLWLNLNPQNRIEDVANHIFKDGLDPSENEECLKAPAALRALEKGDFLTKEDSIRQWFGVRASFLYQVSKWADIQPGAQINLWFDSALATQKAIQNTLKMISAISTSRGVDLKLRDIRQLPTLQGEIRNIFHPGTPVYFRVDLLKVLIAHYMCDPSTDSPQYCVVSDIDMMPMSREQLFDRRTVGYLNTKGYVFISMFPEAQDRVENGFFIFNKTNQTLRNILKTSIIDCVQTKISRYRTYPIGAKDYDSYSFSSTSVFALFRDFVKQIQEVSSDIAIPFKPMSFQQSQFTLLIPPMDHQAETFRFVGQSDIPYTRNGRNYSFRGDTDEKPIEALIPWVAEPLPILDSTS